MFKVGDKIVIDIGDFEPNQYYCNEEGTEQWINEDMINLNGKTDLIRTVLKGNEYLLKNNNWRWLNTWLRSAKYNNTRW